MNVFRNNNFDQFWKRSADSIEPSGTYLLSGFAAQEVSSLLHMREAFKRGQYAETTQEFKRLMFARWLVSHGRLQG